MNDFSAKVEQFNNKGGVKAYMSGASSIAQECASKSSKKARAFQPLNKKVLTAYIMGVVLAPAVISATAAGYGVVVAGVACSSAIVYAATRLMKKISNRESALIDGLKNKKSR